jgi:hypothetical protein
VGGPATARGVSRSPSTGPESVKGTVMR